MLQAADNWIDELEDVTCQEKESKVELACKFSNPKARVSWYKNKLEVFQGLKYKLTNEDGVFRLYINNAAMEDAGKYTCQANTQETSCYLKVEGWLHCILIDRWSYSFVTSAHYKFSDDDDWW